MNKNNIIVCPFCGAEYHPSEIYIPEDFLPDLSDLVKDENGKIVAVKEQLMNLNEEYCCDKCNHTFYIHANVSFVTGKEEAHDFNFDYISPLYTEDRNELKED